MTFSPFEQFELNIFSLSILNLKSIGIDLSITNLTITLIFIIFVLINLISLSIYHAKIYPSRWQSVIELIYKFVQSLIKEQIGNKGQRFFPLIFIVFFLILSLNLIGLLPFSFTVSAQIAITFSLALSFFIGLIIIGFIEQGISFLKIFVPSGIPNWLLPLLVLIEIMSFFLRPLSLSIRLFANMLAGHVLLHIIAGAVLVALAKNILISFVPWLFIIIFLILEIGIAFLQAYVFSILLCIYLHDSIYGH
jgi:F-type H+-transporting ATPase subunit a